jgi:hypothetical protein
MMTKMKTKTGEHAEGDDQPELLTLHAKEEAEYSIVSPSAKMSIWRILVSSIPLCL